MDSPTDQFRAEVFPQELGYVKKRWQTIYSRRQRKETLRQREGCFGEPSAGGEGEAPAAPAAGNKLVGLAFSGGGIRSATINLGVAQALHKRRALDHVDYMSTVSGGGYLGSSLSTIMRDGAEFPYEHSDGAQESPYLTWLRNHSNYLAERGFLDYARMIAVLLRGIVVNFLVLVPLLLVLSVAMARWAVGGDGGLHFDGSNWADVYFMTWVVAGAALFYILSFPVVVRVFKVLGHGKTEKAKGSDVKLRDKFERSFSGILLVVAGLAVIESLPILLYYFHELRGLGISRATITGAGGGVSITALTLVGKLLERFKGVKRTLVIWVVGLLGLILPLLLVLYVAEGLVPAWKVWTEVGLPAWALLAVFVGLVVGGLLASAAAKWLKGTLISGVVGVAGLALAAGAILVSAYFGALSRFTPELFVLTLAVAVWLFCWLSIDINLTSVHGFYRDRLATAYLVGVDVDTRRGAKLEEIDPAGIDIEQDLNLQDICQGEAPGDNPSIAPYHIVNVAHNLQSSKDPGIRERNSDFFMFSKKYYGGARTGYCSTESLEAVFPQMDLATAMAISAAAAAPNMGGTTIGSLVAIMTLFNIRLGYWVPNPSHLAPWAKAKGEPLKSSLWTRFRWRIRPLAFLKEMFSQLNETSRWVNLSDGGHMENLAVYELLRRRCKYIIAGDGEADPEIQFGSLAKLKRFARIDMGIEIDILLDDVRKGDDGRSHQHCAFGKITYPEKDAATGEHHTGYLLYVKSSVTGDEDEVIREYRASHPAFPHESTADQFFDEGQFEAYRALGFHAVDGLFDAGQSVGEFADFETWFRELESNLAPSLAAEKLFLELQSELSGIQDLLQKEEYSHYFYRLYPALTPEGFEPPADQVRRNLFLVGRQLRLMENVFVALDLDRPRNRTHAGNQGWMTLFHDWARAWKEDSDGDRSFIEAYESRIRLHSWKFREFCVEVLELPEVPEKAV